jgi:hypothetical protein
MSDARSDRSRDPDIVDRKAGADHLESVKEFPRGFVDYCAFEKPHCVGIHVVCEAVSQEITERFERWPAFCLAMLRSGPE